MARTQSLLTPGPGHQPPAASSSQAVDHRGPEAEPADSRLGRLSQLARSSDRPRMVSVLQRRADDRTQALRCATPAVAQRLADAANQPALRVRALGLEARVEAVMQGMPGGVGSAFGQEHPLLDPIRAEFVRINAPIGVDDEADIDARLDALDQEVASFEAYVARNDAAIHAAFRPYTEFGGELAELDGKKKTLTGRIVRQLASASEIGQFEGAVQAVIGKSSKEVSALREENRDTATILIRRLIAVGLLEIEPLNKFYASSFDAARDAFGAAASMKSTGRGGALQWLNAWEFHIHGKALRTQGDAVDDFQILTGHIKPSGKKTATGISITVDDLDMLTTVHDASLANVTRWAATRKGEAILKKT